MKPTDNQVPARVMGDKDFTSMLFEVMKQLDAGIEGLELYEFRYGLDNFRPAEGWQALDVVSREKTLELVTNREFFMNMELKPRSGGRIVLDRQITYLNRMLFCGLANGMYPVQWVTEHFFFDVRGFYFLPRTKYYTEKTIAHFGGKPFKQFKQKQRMFNQAWQIGYKEFAQANAEIDEAFLAAMLKLVKAKGTPLLISLAGPTAAGKTEIVARLQEAFLSEGRNITTLEMDNFLIDREYREKKPMGRDTVHFEIFLQSLKDILAGRRIVIPRYDFVMATSSHDLEGNLKSGGQPLIIEPSDVIFLEGNFPFHMKEVADLITLKVVYLTDDPIRLKRKWTRDVDFRKKYDPAYLMNRFFQTQFMRAEDCYRPLMEVCDLVVDTTAASLWVIPGLQEIVR